MRGPFRGVRVCPGVLLLLLLAAPPAAADGQVTYDDIATDPDSGLLYERTPSARNAAWEAIKAQPTYTLPDLFVTPLKPRGAPGVALFDHDGDGDLDIYVTNGPGSANSLFSNQLVESGSATFVDVAVASGADLTAQDSNGVCAGDIDNDGDQDLYVLGSMEPNRLLENQGDGTFVDITAASGAGGGAFESTTCSMGDIDGDGLLDIAIANTFDMWEQFAIFVDAFGYNQHNQLLQNQGGNTFADISAASGLHETRGFIPPADGSPTITWSIMMLDYDQDGDVDIITADDQAAIPNAVVTLVLPFGAPQNRGFIHAFENDGTGHFTDRTADFDLNNSGQWMGVSAGDVNCDGALDLFGSNFGDYAALVLVPEYAFGLSSSRIRLGLPDGSGFSDSGPSLIDGASVFGWGTSMLDYDNDGDVDIVYHGGLDIGPDVDASNPGVMLQNTGECSSRFVYDASATSATDHVRRTVHGLAVGDLDDDGFDDIVTVSNFDLPAPIPLLPYPPRDAPHFDTIIGWVPTFAPTPDPGVFVFTGITFPNGSLSVELSNGNGNGSAKVETFGSVGLLPAGASNRDGVGAVVSMTLGLKGPRATRPVTAGSSYASTDSKVLTFGMGQYAFGTVDVLWPGGVRNRLYGVLPGEHLIFPEIPCSYDADWPSLSAYLNCVNAALSKLKQLGVINLVQKLRFAASALIAFGDDADPTVVYDCAKPWMQNRKECRAANLPPEPAGFADLPAPLTDDDFHPTTPAKVELGKMLFFDKIQSGNQNQSCGTCHHPFMHDGDGLSLSVGEGGRGLSVLRTTGEGAEAIHEREPRNSLSETNIGAKQAKAMLWDGRIFASDRFASGFRSDARWQLPSGLDSPLAVQSIMPQTSTTEMTGFPGENPMAYAAANVILTGPNGVWEQIMQRIRAIPEYFTLFQSAFPGEINSPADMSIVHVGNAMAAFQTEAFRFDNSPFDRFLRGDWRAMSPSQVRGALLFYGEAGCSRCHSGALQSDFEFHAIAMPQIGNGNVIHRPFKDGWTDLEDFGAERVTGDINDRYRFRTPSLRNVALNAPYGHDGAYDSLEAVVEHHFDPVGSLYDYDRSQAVLPSRPDLDALDFVVMDDDALVERIAAANELEPLWISASDFNDLIDFLHALTDPGQLDRRTFTPTKLPSGLTAAE